MAKDDDFFDKYVTDSTSKRKGSVKKDLVSEKLKNKNTNSKSNDLEKEELKEELTQAKDKVNFSKRKTEIVEETKIESAKEEKTEVSKKPRQKKIEQKENTQDVQEQETSESDEYSTDSLTDNLETQSTMQSIEIDENEPQTKSKRKSKRDITIEDYNTNYVTKSLSQTIHDSMIPYSEYVIMDRAIPRVEDGLKPVQRRVLYSMLEVGVLPDRPYKKSATIVGDCMGKYHPHGDASIYDTLVRLAQPFNMGEPLVDGHGNFGSVDGDPPAASRYTEAKLSPIALELLRDLEKNTVPWGLNFDDRLKEPLMLPGRFPNLLVNGCQGIAVGLATNIPTHNFAEACNAVIAYIDNNKITLDELMKIMPAPDFPSGGYILDNSEVRQMYETGRGKIYIRSKISIENGDNGKKNIVITEIPFQVNKASMLQKIAKYRDANPNGPMGYIQEIVDESDRSGTRAVIKLKKDAKINSILNLLYKYCDVQTTFGANIVAIADGKPRQMGLIEILDYYVKYQQQVIFNRTNYDLEEALKKEHILEGLLIAIRNIDEVVRIIKNSKSVTDAKITLIKTFELSDVQAQAILDMRLARLTNLEVNKLITDLNRLRDLIKRYTAIVKSPILQMKVVKSELNEIVKQYAKPRKTKFLSADEHFEDSSSILDSMEDSEDIQTYHFISTPENTLKLVNLKSYNLVTKDLSANPTLSEIPSISFKVDDNKDLYIFTNLGNCIKMPVKAINECRFRDRGTTLFSLVKNIDKDENIVAVLELDNSLKNHNLLFVTKSGMIKISKVSDYFASKQVIGGIKIGRNDELLMVDIHNPDKKLCMFTGIGNGVKISTSDISITGRMSSGIKGIALDKNDYLVGAMQTDSSDAVTCFMSDGSAKIVKDSEIAESVRNRKGLNYVSPKCKNGKLVKVFKLSIKSNFVLESEKGKLNFVQAKMIPIDTRTGSGKQLLKEKVKAVYPFLENK